MERKLVYNQNLSRTLQTGCHTRQLKKIVDNRAGVLGQLQMLTQFRRNRSVAAPVGVPSASLNPHASGTHAGDPATSAALTSHGLDFTNTMANQTALLAFIHANQTKDNGGFHNILLDGATNPYPSSGNPSQWLGYVINPNGSVTVTHIGPFGESPTGVAAQL